MRVKPKKRRQTLYRLSSVLVDLSGPHLLLCQCPWATPRATLVHDSFALWHTPRSCIVGSRLFYCSHGVFVFMGIQTPTAGPKLRQTAGDRQEKAIMKAKRLLLLMRTLVYSSISLFSLPLFFGSVARAPLTIDGSDRGRPTCSFPRVDGPPAVWFLFIFHTFFVASRPSSVVFCRSRPRRVSRPGHKRRRAVSSKGGGISVASCVASWPIRM